MKILVEFRKIGCGHRKIFQSRENVALKIHCDNVTTYNFIPLYFASTQANHRICQNYLKNHQGVQCCQAFPSRARSRFFYKVRFKAT